MKRKLLIAVGGFIAIIIVAFYYYQGKQSKTDAYKFIPNTAIFVIETDEPIDGWKKLSNSAIWQHVKEYEGLKSIGQSANFIDTLIEENSKVFSAMGQRNLLISAHTTGYKEYAFLYTIDVQTVNQGPLRVGLVSILKSTGFKHEEKHINNTDVQIFTSKEDGSKLYLSFRDKYVLCSYSLKVLKESFAAERDAEFRFSSEKFKEGKRQIKGNNDCSIIVNYDKLPPYLMCYLDRLSDETMNVIQSLDFSFLDAKIKYESYFVEGLTSIKDSSSSYVQALKIAGKSDMNIQSVISDKTALLIRLGFEDFPTFYDALNITLKLEDKLEDFNNQKNKIEKYLGLNLEEDFLSWIGDEIGLIQYEKEFMVNHKLQNLVALKVSNMDDAINGLKKIEEQFRKRTPVKFTSSEYKGYLINYMEVKGVFKLIFGDVFSKIEKPYYTFIKDYVLFSDDIKTLLFTIESFKKKESLENDRGFKKFVSKMNLDNSFFTYISFPKYYSNLEKLLDSDSKKEANKNKNYITCFKHTALGLASNKKGFNTQFATNFELEEDKTEMKEVEEENFEVVTDMEMFVIEHLQNNVRKLYHENGNLKLLAELRNNKYHGAYFEYHENGTIKIKGRYKAGNKKGVFKIYNEKGIKKGKEYY